MIDWSQINRVLLVRLRSLGDTVLMTPSLALLKQFRPDLHVAVLLEKPSAPLLKRHPHVDEVIVLSRMPGLLGNVWRRWHLVQRLRRASFDAVFDLHGGPTATMLCYLSGARHRIGYAGYRHSWMLTHRAPDPEVIWQKSNVHSVEQQAGLLKWAGVPIQQIPPTSLYAREAVQHNVASRLRRLGIDGAFALIHPGGTAEDKRWPVERFARLIEALWSEHGLASVIIGTRRDKAQLDELTTRLGPRLVMMVDLHLKELVALCALARLFVGNDSGPAHVAMSQRCPTVVIFGASNYHVWRPWGDAPHQVVQVERDATGRLLAPSERIAHVSVDAVVAAVEHVLSQSTHRTVRVVEPSA
ncbi:MAG: glycosyltransferase family 9 protein [Acidobacteriota bacterium]|nr:glycosyltransferase family 9 protein [Blastocatellia bacterium]MDW8239189.1 glycosyltransferase family 9 protein [Acidobacteriota bacterium]